MTAKFVGWMMSAIILLLIFVTAAILQNSVRLLITGKRAEGLVVGMETLSSRLSNSTEASPLQTPIVEFVTSAGERVRVSGRAYSATASLGIGETVKVAYSESNPRDAQFLILKEFPLGITGFMLGFTAFVLFIWISCILISKDPAYGDPFHILNKVIARFRLTPYRFPIFFLLSVVIPLCGLASYMLYKQAFDLRSNGIRVVGKIIGSEELETSTLSDNSTVSGRVSMIEYKDASGAPHKIRRSLTTALSHLKTGDMVEVIYPAGQPNKGIVNTWDELYLVPLFFGFMALAFLILFRLLLCGHIQPAIR